MEEDNTLLDQKKKKHPLENANILSKLFFWSVLLSHRVQPNYEFIFSSWLLPYFVKGYKRELNENDLYGALECHQSARLGNKLEAAWKFQVTKDKPSLLAALLKVFRVELAAYGVLYLIQEFIVKLSQPLLISKFLKLYEPDQRGASTNDIYIYAGLIVLFALLNVMCVHTYYFYVMHLGMKIRVATCSLIYRKALKLNKSALADTTVGQMVNLLTNDVGRFDFAVQYVHNLWVAPIETAVIMYLLYVNVGPTGLTGVCFLILFIVPQMYMGKQISQYRSRTAKCTDERVRLMGEIINGIQVIKMYTWEKSFAKLIEVSRQSEMNQIWATSIIRAIMITCITVLHRSAIYLCVLTYILTGNIIDATYVYTIASFYNILRQAITMFLPRAVSQFAETRISLQRIEKFLSQDEILLSNENNNVIDEKDQRSNSEEYGVHLKNVSVKWKQDSQENVLDNITFDATFGEIVAVVGKVGEGKTTLLNTVLRELAPAEGSVRVGGTVSYVSQEPWLFEGSIKKNIIFGEKFNSEKYDRVLRACDLEKDLLAFTYGDQTLVGDLSGGQKARVNLARAVYKDADIYLLDDPLSAVDTRVGKHLFDNCICGYLKDKCVVLVTNQLQYLKNIDNIYLIGKGKIEAKGSYNELRQIGNKFTDLLVEDKDEEAGNKVEETKLEEVKETKNNGKPVQDREQRGSGKISKRVYKSYLQAGGSWFKTGMVLSAFLFAQIFAILSDYFVILWVNLEQWRSEHKTRESSTTTRPLNDTLNNEEVMKNGTINKNQEKSIQGALDLILTENNSLIIYSLLIILSVILALTRSTYFFKYCVTASTKLHNLMFNNIIKAPMRFFSTNPPGRILNRFSKDIGTIDEILPMTVADTLQIALILLSISVVVGYLYPWVLLPTVVIVVIFYYIRLVFLATSRDLKRVEAVTRSPIYTHLRSSVQGLTTIRAFGSQDLLRKEFDCLQDQYTAASFMFLGANRTFGFWLDLHCVIYAGCVVLSILFIKSEIFGGNVGFALTEAVSLTGMFQWGIRQWSEMENQMTSVERIQEYIEEALEEDKASKEPPELWPEEGHIQFDGVCLRYSARSPYVLNNLTFEIKPKEKIGIVGRTGAGKSSIIFALFRLTDTDGVILIDNTDVKEIPLDTLRSKISIIPQEPMLFSGTLRDNLDPFGDFSDDMIWKALENVELRNAINDLSQGLETKISEGGSNFSVGQRQLICLARAIIRNNKILVLDEATANVDPYTDNVIQTTIGREFADCTVLTVAHRLHTIMDSDKVLVMHNGEVVEYAHPHVLLQNPNGHFYGLVSQTGKVTAELLAEQAEQYYKERTKKKEGCKE